MKSKLTVLSALLALTAVFGAAPALAAAPAVTWVGPANANVRTPDSLQITTDGTETNVQFYFRDSALIGTITEAPADTYTMAFDPDDYANGLGDLRADVTNADGTTQQVYGINIDNTAWAPNWNAPTEGQEIMISGGYLLQTGTTVEQDAVEYFLDGVSVGQAVEEGGVDSNDWRLQLDTSGYALGAHVLRAVSTNGTLTSVPTDINVTFVDDIDPQVLTYSPVSGSTVAGSFGFTITTSDNVGPVSAAYSFDNASFAPMALQGGSDFTATVDVSALANGTGFIYVEVTDARGNVGIGNVEIDVANPQAPALDTGELEYYGSIQVGSEGMDAFGAAASGVPTPTIGYRWNVCSGGDCTVYPGQSYDPIAADVGRTVELVVTATNSEGSDVFTQMIDGVVTAAPVVVEPETPQSSPAPEQTPVVTPPVVVVQPVVVVAPLAAPVATVIVNTSSAPQKVTGTAGPDRIVTGKGYDVIRAGAGADVISPGKGSGLVYAGPGNDIVRALASKNLYVNCGTGKDTLFANQTTKSVGCEKVVVASNNKLVTVKVGLNGLPLFPANHNGPYALVPKAPAVIAADRKAAVAEAALAKKEAAVVVAVKKDAVAVKAVAVAKPALATAITATAAAEKKTVAAEKAVVATKAELAGAVTAKKGVADAKVSAAAAAAKLAAAKAAEVAAGKAAVAASAKVVATTKAVVETKTVVVAAAEQQAAAAGRVANTSSQRVVVTRTVSVEADRRIAFGEDRLAAAEKRRKDTWSDLYAALKSRLRLTAAGRAETSRASAAHAQAKLHIQWAKDDIEVFRLQAVQASSRLSLEQELRARAGAAQAVSAAAAEEARDAAERAAEAAETAALRHRTIFGIVFRP